MRANLRSMIAFTLLVSFIGATTAHAQQVAPGARAPTVEEQQRLHAQWLRARREERRQVRIGLPIVGLIAGAALLGTSAWLATSNDRQTRKGGFVAGILVALPLTALSSAILAKRVKKRRAIGREMAGH